ncbi:MAG: ATP-binding protein [Kiritimatiellae bacterium]|nr:ATP-binding protein [Kiritimatiellia bacterium]
MYEIKQSLSSAGAYDTPVCILGPKGDIYACNNSMAGFLQKNHGKITGRTCREIFQCSRNDISLCPLESIKSRPDTYSIAIQSDHCTIKETAEPVFDDSGKVSAIILSFTNGSGHSSITPDLIRLQKLETVAQTAGGIVHDLNNILMCVDAEINIVKEQLKELTIANNSSTGKHISSVLSTIAKGHGLTRQLLKLSKGQQPGKEPTAIGEIIREATSFSLLGSHVDATVNITDDLWPIRTNAEQVFQLISNLVINARHSMKASEKGQIVVMADNMPENEVHALRLKPGKYISISVQDKGHGIPSEHVERIFEPFFTTKHDGTGLGLALVKLIVKELLGHITVESTVGKGSKFTVYIPALDLDTSMEPTEKIRG